MASAEVSMQILEIDPRQLSEQEFVEATDEGVIDVTILEGWPDIDAEETLYILPEIQEMEVVIESTADYDNGHKVFTDLDRVQDDRDRSSDYGSESGVEQMTDHDLTQGSIDLSNKGHNGNPSKLEIYDNGTVTSNGYFPNGHVMTHKPYYPSPEISVDRSDEHCGRDCLDLSRTGPYSTNGGNLLHYNGGTVSIDMRRQQNDVTNNGQFDLTHNGTYLQLPSIKLEPGLGIDPTITYKSDMDYNHNHNDHLQPAVINIPYDQSPILSSNHILSGCDPIEGARVMVEEVNTSRIPLTVTTAEEDEEIDSGTESIDSKDSENSLSLGNDDTPCSGNKDKSDRKRPGRKKGQVSKVYHLWEFIRDVLNDPRHCGKVIKWENEEEGIFRVVQSEVAASMWGAKKKNRTKMTYEKMSRSIRYSRKEGYFDDIPKDKGYPKKLCFKFGKKAHGWNIKRAVSVEGH